MVPRRYPTSFGAGGKGREALPIATNHRLPGEQIRLRKALMEVKIFICYAHEDEPLLNKLKSHLAPLQGQGLIDVWHDRDISAGTEWQKEISKHLNEADIILLLVSPDFMNSDYCYSLEMQQALKRHKLKDAIVIPIILRPCHWEIAPFARLLFLPMDGKAVSSWRDRNEAFKIIALIIRQAANELTRKKQGIAYKTTNRRDFTHLLINFQENDIKLVTEEMWSKKVDDVITIPREIIIEFLSIIGYEDDKEAYAREFINLSQNQALIDCEQSLPLREQEKFKKQMHRAKDLEQVTDLIRKYFSREQFLSAVERAIQVAFTELVQQILPGLNRYQKKSLEFFFTKVNLRTTIGRVNELANQEHLERLKQGSTIWNEWRAQHSEIRPDLSGADLLGADLEGVNLRAADLEGVNLEEANLHGAHLEEANLRAAHLKGVNLEEANLHGAHLEEANLHGAHLEEANLTAADLEEANLRAAHLKGAFIFKADLSEADLRAADLRSVHLAGALQLHLLPHQ
jgi:uncharacterized protein YjbI with pentapeptide repeats